MLDPTDDIRKAPIGVLDSGVGGFTLLGELMRAFPAEKFIYVADTENFPLGDKSEATVRQSGLALVDYLVQQGCKLVLIACNTLSGLLLDEDEDGRNFVHHLRVPIVGVINYGCLSAALYVTHNFRLGLMATTRTIEGGSYERHLKRFDPTLDLESVSCSELIPLIEQGQLGSPRTREVVEKIVAPLKKEAVDTVILGCTHLPLVRDIIQEAVGHSVTLIDPAKRTVAIVRKLLVDKSLVAEGDAEIKDVKFYCTGPVEEFNQRLILLDKDLPQGAAANPLIFQKWG